MTVYISDCKQYLARTRQGFEFPDVFGRNGSVWRGSRYRATGWDDTDPRFVYPEFRHMVVAWGNRGHAKRNGDWVVGFDVAFGEYDQSKRWRDSGVDARIGEMLRAECHNVCPPKRPPRWVREIMDSVAWKLDI